MGTLGGLLSDYRNSLDINTPCLPTSAIFCNFIAVIRMKDQTKYYGCNGYPEIEFGTADHFPVQGRKVLGT